MKKSIIAKTPSPTPHQTHTAPQNQQKQKIQNKSIILQCMTDKVGFTNIFAFARE